MCTIFPPPSSLRNPSAIWVSLWLESYSLEELIPLIYNDHRFLAQITKSPGCKAMSRWCSATSSLRFCIFNATLPKRFINTYNDLFFSCQILTSEKEVRWWGLLVANCISKWVTNILKQSIELEGSWVNQFTVGPFKDVGKTRKKKWHHPMCTTLLVSQWSPQAHCILHYIDP